MYLTNDTGEKDFSQNKTYTRSFLDFDKILPYKHVKHKR